MASWRIANEWGAATGQFTAIAATGPGSAWAIGALTRGTAPTGPLVAHWNGKAWQTATASVFTGYTLYEISASSPGNVWVLGVGKSSSLDRKAFRFDGAHWHALDLPPIDNATPQELTAIGSNEAWLLGSGGATATDVWRWDGATWTNHPVSADITSLAGVSDTNVEAAGLVNVSTANWQGTLVAYRWTGAGWTRLAVTPFARQIAPTINMNGGGDVWIGAASVSGSATTTFAVHWNGAKWGKLTVPATPGWFKNAVRDVIPDGRGGAWFGPYVHFTGGSNWVTMFFPVAPGASTWGRSPGFPARPAPTGVPAATTSTTARPTPRSSFPARRPDAFHDR